MAKRQVPDFDGMAAFDQALARKKPELVMRLGGSALPVSTESPVAAQADESVLREDDSTAAGTVVELREEPSLKIVTPEDSLKVVSLEDSDPRPAAKRMRRGVVARANGQELRRLTVYVELSLAQLLREHCFKHELNLSEVAAEALGVGLKALIARQT